MKTRLSEFKAAVRKFFLRPKKVSNLDYWKTRAKKFGKRSVLNIRHAENEMETVTRYQVRELFPVLQEELKGGETLILDFGCGPGRFTAPLAALTGATVIGVDPTESLLELAPQAPRVEYRPVHDGRIPLEDASADVVWVCLVLGCIPPAHLEQAAHEIQRVLKSGGLLFLVDGTAEKPDTDYYHYRSADRYRALFPRVTLRHVHDYFDLGERISVLAGRKIAQN